jgi:hypothetical protein
MRPAVPPWWDETTDSHTPLGGRYRTGGELATANFGEFDFYVVHEYGKKKGHEAANSPDPLLD